MSVKDALQFAAGTLTELLSTPEALQQAVQCFAQGDFDGALLVATRHGADDLARLLLRAGASVNASEPQTLASPLYYACASPSSSLAAVLISAKAGTDVQVRPSGATPLLVAARQGHATVVAALLAAGADATLASADGNRAVDAAAEGGHLPVVRLLSPPPSALLRAHARRRVERRSSARQDGPRRGPGVKVACLVNSRVWAKVSPSLVHGVGLTAIRPIPAGTIVDAPARLSPVRAGLVKLSLQSQALVEPCVLSYLQEIYAPLPDGSLLISLNEFDACSFVNHADGDAANVEQVVHAPLPFHVLKTTRSVHSGEELLLDYRSSGDELARSGFLMNGS